MQSSPIPQLHQACRIFLAFAYPDGPSSIPAKKRAYFDLPMDESIAGFLPPTASALGVCQEIRGENGAHCGYDLRLGSSEFAHLKLRMQVVKHENQDTWVYMVDTHDAFSKHMRLPPPDHPDGPVWLQMQSANRLLKEKIEAAFEDQGLATLNSLLRKELHAPS